MTTYASPKAISAILLITNSLLFILAAYIASCGLIQLIGIDGMGDLPPLTSSASSLSRNNSNSTAEYKLNGVNQQHQQHVYEKDRFPSVGSGAALFFFGVLSTMISVLGCVAVQLQSSRLLNVYGYGGVFSWFLKFLFIFASVKMHAGRMAYDPVTSKFGYFLLFTAIIEFILGLSACHLAKIVKRGDAALPRIEPLPMKIT